MITSNGENESSGAGSHDPSRNTGRGVYFCGEFKWFNHEDEAKAIVCNISETHGVKAPVVTRIRPETQ